MTQISIIIPTYNYGHYIRYALHSILEQLKDSDLDVEILVIDDCSTDNTRQIIEQYSQYSFIKVLVNNQNLGPAKSRNKAITEASGQYILFLDADDMLTAGSLQTIVDFISTHDLPEVIISDHHSVVRANNSEMIIKKTINNTHLSQSKNQRFKDYLFHKRLSIGAGSIIFNKSVLDKFKFCEKAKLNEDIPLFAHAVVNFDCKYLPFSTANIFKHADSLRNHHQLLSEEMNTQRLTEIIFDPQYIPAELMYLKNRFLSLRYLSLFRSYYLAKQYSKAKEIYLKAIKIHWQNVFKVSYLGKFLRCV